MALAGAARLKLLFPYMGLPVGFKELGIEHPDIDRMLVSLRRNKGELLGNYVKLTMTDCREIYRWLYNERHVWESYPKSKRLKKTDEE